VKLYLKKQVAFKDKFYLIFSVKSRLILQINKLTIHIARNATRERD